jgi:electron transfer flavoprotein alpha subunit
MAGVLVIAETNEAGVAPVSYELLGAARQLAAAGAGSVSAFVAGTEEQAKTLIAHGADAAYAGTNPALASKTGEVMVPAIEAAIAQSGADIVLIGQTSMGRDLAPALAFKAATAVAMDCVELAIVGGRLRATRSCYGGNARAEHTWKATLQIATVKAKSFDPLEADAARSGSVSTIDTAGEARVKVLGSEKAVATGVRLEDATIVVSGGRGLGDPSAFKLLEDLAGVLKGAVGASRAACDLGWYPPAQQVGLTGKTVSPMLYIAVAISGASQHMAGMAGSKNIIAINKDKEAPIFGIADLGIVGDVHKVLPKLIEALRARP